MAGFNLLKKAEDWTSLAAGLRAYEGAIELEAGQGLAWDGNSLEMDVLPSSPWINTVTGGSTFSIVEGQLLEIYAPSTFLLSYSSLNSPTWDENFTTGFQSHIKCNSVLYSGNAALRFDVSDGSGLYRIELHPDRLVVKGASTDTTIDVAKYPFPELFILVVNNLMSIWIFNPFTDTWDSILTGKAPLANSTDLISFGNLGTSAIGRGFFGFIRWRSTVVTTPYNPFSPVATMGAVALPIGTVINGLGNFRTSKAGSSTLQAQYNINDSGWSSLFDDIEALNSFLFNNPVTVTNKTKSLDLIMVPGSNGFEQAKFWPGEGPNLTHVSNGAGKIRSRSIPSLGKKEVFK